MNIKKHFFLIGIAIILLTGFSTLSFSDEIEAEDLYNLIRESYESSLPDDFIAAVDSQAIRESLEEIPAWAITDEPVVRFVYSRELGEQIIVENVERMYRYRFSSHLQLYNSYRVFLDSLMDYEAFTDLYDWQIISQDEDEIEIYMHDKNLNDDTFYLITVEADTYLMSLAESYSRGEFIGMVNVTYYFDGTYSFPRIIDGYGIIENEEGIDETRSFRFTLTGYQANVGVTEEDM